MNPVALAPFLAATDWGHILAYYILLPILASLLAGAALLVITTVVSRRLATAKVSEDKRLEGAAQIGEVYDLLAGAKATELNPDPPPGLRRLVTDTADKLEEVALGLMAMDDRVKAIEFTLTTNGNKHNTVLDNLQQIRHNTTTVDGDGRPIIVPPPAPPEEPAS